MHDHDGLLHMAYSINHPESAAAAEELAEVYADTPRGDLYNKMAQGIRLLQDQRPQTKQSFSNIFDPKADGSLFPSPEDFEPFTHKEVLRVLASAMDLLDNKDYFENMVRGVAEFAGASAEALLKTFPAGAMIIAMMVMIRDDVNTSSEDLGTLQQFFDNFDLPDNREDVFERVKEIAERAEQLREVKKEMLRILEEI